MTSQVAKVSLSMSAVAVSNTLLALDVMRDCKLWV